MKAPSEFSRSIGRGRGIIELSKMTAMEAKLDTIMNRMDKQERKMHTAHEVGVVERELLRGSADVPTEELFYDAEEVKYLGEPRSYHFKPNPNLPAHYHPALRNYEKIFLWWRDFTRPKAWTESSTRISATTKVPATAARR